jgi:uncharacterized membrane protein
MEGLGPAELQQLEDVEQIIASLRAELGSPPESLSSRAADKVATIVGSWSFLLTQGALLVLYMLGQVYFLRDGFDPYPFILLNLMLSFQAAFTAPIILMAQNRADAKDRRHARKAHSTIAHVEELLKALAVEIESQPEDDDDDGGDDGGVENGSS